MIHFNIDLYCGERMRKLIRNCMHLVVCLSAVAFLVISANQNSETVMQKEQKVVALTYDDGPSKKSTLELLAVLKEYDAHATFFINGNHANDNKDLVKEIVDQGHEIGNHTLDHVWLTKVSDEEVAKQVYGNENLLRFLSNQEGEMLLRPPYGDINDSLIQTIDRPIVMWSVDSRDWEAQNVSSIKNNILKDVGDGEIIIMHDGYKESIEGTRQVLEELKKQNYRVVSVSELFELKGKTMPLHEKIKRCKE